MNSIERFYGIIKSEMYQMYEITDEVLLKHAITDYIMFYIEELSAGQIPLQFEVVN